MGRKNSGPREIERADGRRTRHQQPVVAATDRSLEEQVTASSAQIGARFRALRVGRHLSIEAVAKRSGVSTGRISELERGLANPSFDTLWRLAHALDEPLSSFFDGLQSNGNMIVRRGKGKRLLVPSEGLEYELLTPDLLRALEVYRVSIPANFDHGAYRITHTGEECIHLLSGRLMVFIGDDEYTLAEGDSITYNSALPHSVANRWTKPAVVIASVTPPSF